MSDLTLDHVILAVTDPASAAALFSTVLGRTPSWRGRHPSYGTANVLYRLDRSYVELLAPDPEATSTSAWTGSLGRFLNERGEGLFSVALQTPDIARTVAEARSRGLPVEDPAEGEGVDEDTGARRRWTNARVPPEATRGTRCFFIRHLSPPEALPQAGLPGRRESVASDVLAIGIESSEPDGARRMWREVFGLAEEAGPGGGRWRYSLGNAGLVLEGSSATGTGGEPDRWSSLALRVGSLNDAIARLAQSRIAYEHTEALGLRGVGVRIRGARLLLTGAR